MAIRLEVENYCHACLDFTPDVIKPTRLYLDNVADQTDTIVQCEYKRRCAGIKRYLEQQAKNELKCPNVDEDM